jgi:hypothetical protein
MALMNFFAQDWPGIWNFPVSAPKQQRLQACDSMPSFVCGFLSRLTYTQIMSSFEASGCYSPPRLWYF